jgi:dUTP pyrophosphatase
MWLDKMLRIKIQVNEAGKNLGIEKIWPKKATKQSAAFDLVSTETFTIQPNEIKMVDAGFAMEMPSHFFALARPRSGLASKHGIMIATSGIIDSDYRGPIKVPLINHGQNSYSVTAGDRIAQMLILPVIDISLEQVDQLSESERGTGGFGSTGKA